jgi:hypothetical protein
MHGGRGGIQETVRRQNEKSLNSEVTEAAEGRLGMTTGNRRGKGVKGDGSRRRVAGDRIMRDDPLIQWGVFRAVREKESMPGVLDGSWLVPKQDSRPTPINQVLPCFDAS